MDNTTFRNKRVWNILNWNIRGINGDDNVMLLDQKLKKAIVQSIVFKKQREATLITHSLGR